jgi:hypothetical protein
MRIILMLVLSSVAVIGMGCSNGSSCGTDNELVYDLYGKMATHSDTIKLVFEGSESNYGPIRVEIEDPQVINKVWEMIENSKPGGRQYACGWVTIEFYYSGAREMPNAKLRVLCGGDDASVYVEGCQRSVFSEQKGWHLVSYQCPGLGEYVMTFIEEEFNKQK